MAKEVETKLKAEQEEKAEGLDFILAEIGEFGKFQKRNLCLLSLQLILAGMFGLTYVFTAVPLDYR